MSFIIAKNRVKDEENLKSFHWIFNWKPNRKKGNGKVFLFHKRWKGKQYQNRIMNQNQKGRERNNSLIYAINFTLPENLFQKNN